MKHTILLLLFLFGTSLFGQEKILNQSELDSITASDSKKESTMPMEAIETVETVPIYKGCKKEKNNTAKMKCMSEKITQLFQKNFDTEMHEESDLIPGMKRISVVFKINTDGTIFDIRARSEDEYMEAEAIRVTKLIPPLSSPGIQNGTPVIIPYSLPILVNMVPNKNEGLTKYPVYRGCDETSSNEELEACSKRKIRNFIKMSYDIQKASRALPTEKSTQFLLEFTISKNGKIENINAKANHKAIAIEAIKVAKRLPKFKAPGIWEGVAVDTPYSLLMTLYFN